MNSSRKTFTLIVALAILVLLLSFLFIATTTLLLGSLVEHKRDYVALIKLMGSIDYSSGGLFHQSGITPDHVKSYVEQVLSDPYAKAVVIEVNSPGGTTAAFEVYELIAKLSEERVVVVYITGYGTSGGYLISLPAHAIVAHPTALVGSVGAISVLISFSGLMNNLGINVEIIASGDLKDVASPFRNITSKDIEFLSRIVNDVALYFSSLVKERRGDKIIYWNEVLRGGAYLATEAKRLGLVDYVGTLDDAIEIAKELAGLPKDAPVREFRKPLSLLELFLGSSHSNFMSSKNNIKSFEVLVMWPLSIEIPEAVIITQFPQT
ncbi:MAG: S49 family peptidase [Acidilobaceae archaeon]